MAGARGRDGRKEARWRRHVAAQGQSVLSVRAYCERHGVSAARFYWWKREIARRDAEGEAEPRLADGRAAVSGAAFAEVRVVDGEPRAGSDPCPRNGVGGAVKLRHNADGNAKPGNGAGVEAKLRQGAASVDTQSRNGAAGEDAKLRNSVSGGEVKSATGADGGRIEVDLGGGRTLRVRPGFDAATFLAVVRLLEGGRRC